MYGEALMKSYQLFNFLKLKFVKGWSANLREMKTAVAYRQKPTQIEKNIEPARIT